MKIRPLPEIDLARIACLPVDQQRKQLERFRVGHPPFTYGPLKLAYHDVFNLQPAMFDGGAPTDWDEVKAKILRKSTHYAQAKANLEVAKGLHNFAIDRKVIGRPQELLSLSLGMGEKVKYWSPMSLHFDGRDFVPFIDPRRSHRLTKEGRRFAFSMMHEGIRAGDPDYEKVGLLIFQFGEGAEGQRAPTYFTDDGVALISMEQLEAMVDATYRLWKEVCEDATIEARRKATGTRGPLI